MKAVPHPDTFKFLERAFPCWLWIWVLSWGVARGRGSAIVTELNQP